MKKYIDPIAEMVLVSCSDIITASVGLNKEIDGSGDVVSIEEEFTDV